MNKIYTVAIREFIETIKTKAFLIGSVFVPMLMLGLIFGSSKIAEMSEKTEVPTRRIAVVDEDGAVAAAFAEVVEGFNTQNPQRKFAAEASTGADADMDQIRERIATGELYAYLVVTPEVVQGGATCEFGRKDSQLEAGMRIKEMLNNAIEQVRFETADPPVDLERIRALQAKVEFRDVDIRTGEETTGNELTRFMTPFAFMFLLFMGTMSISQGLLTSVIEEKSSRVVEVLLSAVSPTQLMGGKILGMVAVGAVLLGVWGGVGYGAAQARGMGYLVTTHQLAYLVLYFIPGFLLMSSFLAAIGSACNTIKEAQSMAAPLTIMTIVPMMLWWSITQEPMSVLAITLSYIPPLTPFVMILRICADPQLPMFEIVLSLVVLWASVIVMIWMSGKIFRVGVLMYGKPPSPKELIRWLRYA